MRLASERYFRRAECHPNALVAKAAEYTPRLNAPARLRRHRNVLIDPDDPITVPNPPTKPSASRECNTAPSYRTHRRARVRRARTLAHLTRVQYVPGRSTSLLGSTN